MSRPTVYREHALLVSLRALRNRFKPRAWRELRSVALEAHGHRAVVRVEFLPATGLLGGATRRRHLVCPACGAHVSTIAVSEPRGWCCRRCTRWLSLPRKAVPTTTPAILAAEEIP